MRTCRRRSATRRCSSAPTAPSHSGNGNEPSRKPPALRRRLGGCRSWHRYRWRSVRRHGCRCRHWRGFLRRRARSRRRIDARAGQPARQHPARWLWPRHTAAPRNTRFFGTVRLDPERYGRDINRLYQEVIQHLAAPEGVDLEITVEITASKKDGFPDDKTRIVSENARTLKFDQFGFEDH